MRMIKAKTKISGHFRGVNDSTVFAFIKSLHQLYAKITLIFSIALCQLLTLTLSFADGRLNSYVYQHGFVN